jgi:hypothetical protein
MKRKAEELRGQRTTDGLSARVVILSVAGSKEHGKQRGEQGPSDCLPLEEVRGEFLLRSKTKRVHRIRSRKWEAEGV